MGSGTRRGCGTVTYRAFALDLDASVSLSSVAKPSQRADDQGEEKRRRWLSSFHSLGGSTDAMEASQEHSDTPRSSVPAAASSTAPSSRSLSSSSSRPPRHVGESATTTTGDPAVPAAETAPEQPPPQITPDDLARQLAGFAVAAQPPPPTETPQPRQVEPHTQAQEQQEEEEWLLKEIHWPPLPPTPAAATGSAPPPPTSLGMEMQGSAVTTASSSEPGFSTDPNLKVKIICQNENGPCSLIALCTSLQLSPSTARSGLGSPS